MIVVEKLKLNKFRHVSVPSNKDLFMRVGQRILPQMADGQIAVTTNGTMDELDAVEAQLIKDSQIPAADSSIH